MPRPRIGYAGTIALEIHQLRLRNAELEPLARRAKSLQGTVDDLARENLELRKEVYRQKERKRQNSGPRRRNDGGSHHRGDRASSSDANVG